MKATRTASLSACRPRCRRCRYPCTPQEYMLDHHACWTTIHAGPHARRDARTHTTRVTHVRVLVHTSSPSKLKRDTRVTHVRVLVHCDVCVWADPALVCEESHVQSIQAEERQGFGGVIPCASRPGSLTPPPRFPHATAPAPSRHRPGASSGHLQAIDTTLAAISTYSCAIAHSDTNSHPSTNRSSSLSMRASSLVLAAIACGAAGAS